VGVRLGQVSVTMGRTKESLGKWGEHLSFVLDELLDSDVFDDGSLSGNSTISKDPLGRIPCDAYVYIPADMPSEVHIRGVDTRVRAACKH